MGAETWIGIGKFLSAVVFGTATTAPAWAVWGARVALLSLSSKVLTPKIDLSQTARDKKVTVRDPVTTQAVVYGQDILSGPMFVANTTGTDNKFLTMGVLLTGHEIDSFVEFRLDDTVITSGDMTSFPTGDVNAGKFADVASVNVALGTSVQNVNTMLDSAFGSLWTTAHRLRGWSYMAWQFELVEGNTAFDSGAPTNMSAVVKGKRVYDPRLDSTNGGTGTHRLADPTTWEWSDNNALCLADFLRDDVFGMQEDDARIDWPLVIAAADICDQIVTVPSGTQKRYTCNFTFRSDEQRGEVVDAILSGMLGRLVFSQGVWKIWAGAAIVPDVTLTEANLAGAIQVQATAGAKERYNRVRGKYIDASRDYAAQAYPEQRSTTYETEDNGEIRPLVVDWTTCNNGYEAQRNAIITLKQSRQQRVVVFQGNLSCFRIQPGSTVLLTVAEYGFSGEKFFVSDWTVNEQGVALTLIEEIDAAWADPLVGDYTTRTTTGVLTFVDQGVPSPSNLTAATFSGGVQISWTNPPDSMFSHIEIWRANENVRGSATLIATTQGSTFYDPYADMQRSRYYWIRSVSQSGNASAYEPNLTTTTAVAYPEIGEASLIADPFIRLGSTYWDENGDATYVASAGLNGTDALRVQQDTSVKIFYTEPRRGPDVWDVQSPGTFAVEVRWRWKLQTDPGGLWTQSAFAVVRVTDENEANPNNYTQFGSTTFSNGDTTGVWKDDSVIIEVADTGTPPRYIQVGIQMGINALAPTFDFDFIDARLVGQPFAGANKAGLVPDPVTEAGKYLKDDGSWADRYPIVAAESTVTVTDASYEYGDVWRYGAVGDGTADDYQAFADAITASGYVFTSKPPPNRWKIGTTLLQVRDRQVMKIYGNIEYTGTGGLFKMAGYKRANIRCYGRTYGDGTNYCVHFENSISNRFYFNRTGQFDATIAFIQAVGGQAAGHSCTENIIEYNLMYGADPTRSNYGLLFRNTTGDAAVPCEGTQLMGGFLSGCLVDNIRIEANTNAKYLYVEGSVDFATGKDYNCLATTAQNSYLNLKYIRPAFVTLGDGDILINPQDSSITINSVTPNSQCFSLKAENGTAQPITGYKYIGSMEGGNDGTEEYTTILAGASPGLSTDAATNIQAYYKPGTTATPAASEAKEAGFVSTFRRNDDASAIVGGRARWRKKAGLNDVEFVISTTDNAVVNDRFIVRPEGGIGVDNAVANVNTPSGATSDALPIYDETGTLIGYIPIYASQW